MKITDILHFFSELDQRLDQPVQVILTGGAAAIIMGVNRVTHDIDFEIKLKVRPVKKEEAWSSLQIKLEEVMRTTRITPQFSEDIDRWSSIVFPFKKDRLWKKLGKVEIRLLDPALWSIGKLARFLGSDEKDLVTVFQAIKANPKYLVQTWGKALGKSPSSSAQPLFRKHVEVFLKKKGPVIWGNKFDGEHYFQLFLASARATTRA